MKELSRKKAHREHTVRNLATSLLLYEKIDTTYAKAREVKSFTDRVIANSKAGDLNAIRYLNSVLFDKNAVKKVIGELLPRYKERSSGFIKSYHLKNRIGDNAPMLRLVLMDRKVFVDTEATEHEEKPVETDKAKKGK